MVAISGEHLDSVEWNGGVKWWNETVEWNGGITGMEQWNKMMDWNANFDSNLLA